MARQRSTSRPTATSAEANAARALSQLDRMSKVARQSGRVSRVAARVTLSGNHRLELPAQSLQLKDGQVVEAGAFVDRRTALGGSESDSGSTSSSSEAGNRGKTLRVESTWHRATAMVDVARSSRKIPELTHAMDALSRVERSIDSGSTGRAILDARKYASLTMTSDTGAASRARDGREAKRQSFAEAGLRSNVRVAPSIRGVTPPPKISPREFARPSSDVRASNAGGGRAGITINSSPTVVINAPASASVQHDVMGALRTHREELFDQLKRESARRERAQF
jgi:hypothetical protein